MEQKKPRNKQKTITAVLVAISIVAVASILVYKNSEEVVDFGQSLAKKGKSAAKKGLKQSSVLKDRFNDLIDHVENKIRKAVA